LRICRSWVEDPLLGAVYSCLTSLVFLGYQLHRIAKEDSDVVIGYGLSLVLEIGQEDEIGGLHLDAL